MTADSQQRLMRPLESHDATPQWGRGVVGAALLGVAGLLVARRLGYDAISPWIIPAVVFFTGLILVWSPLDSAVHSDARRPDVAGLFTKEAWARTAAGLALAGGALWWFAAWRFTDNSWIRGIVVPVVLVVGAALVLAPWWMRLIRQVNIERLQRIREFERAEIAAHLHDSVLQTLTLIRANATDADTVARLARAQERDLRTYLYQDRRRGEESVARALESLVADVEDTYSVAIDTVSVGDAPLTRDLDAAIRAAREAAANAARHGRPPISVYAEITPNALTIYVRDSGPGFDPQDVPADRLGIRQSIVGRVERHGGNATVASSVGGRTEVVISMPRGE